ncbi:MAG: L7Ae/L30e/S12e/Gadd45 family ribosomal protein [Candidatus Limivicinus sp.]|jgi:ribosomal protein L7Ae-like RNA K-turn-binding protein
MNEKLLNMLGLMRRACAIEIGESAAGSACREGKTKILLLASDASDNARRRAEGFGAGHNLVILRLPFPKEELSAHLGLGGCSMAAITDIGFANAFIKSLSQAYPGEYDTEQAEVEQRFSKAKRRKEETAARGRNKRIGKRRTNV